MPIGGGPPVTLNSSRGVLWLERRITRGPTTLQPSPTLARIGQPPSRALMDTGLKPYSHRSMLWFVLTTGACNMHCRYCGGSFNPRLVPWKPTVRPEDVARFIAARDPKPTVFFYGGEPLLNPAYVMAVMDALKGARFGVQTNGTLVDALPPEYWRRVDVVLLSVDGRGEITDAYRGPGTYERVVKALRYLKRLGHGRVVARMTVTRLTDIYVDVLHLMGLGFDAVHWQLNVLWTDEWGPREFMGWARDRYLPGIRALRDRFVEEAGRGRLLEIIPFLGIYRALLWKRFDWIPCGAGKHALAVGADGRVLACPIAVDEPWSLLGNVGGGLSRDGLAVREECARCRYLGVCGGRCLYMHYGDYWGKEGFEAVCRVTYETIRILEERAGEVARAASRGLIPGERLMYDPLLESTEVIP